MDCAGVSFLCAVVTQVNEFTVSIKDFILKVKCGVREAVTVIKDRVYVNSKKDCEKGKKTLLCPSSSVNINSEKEFISSSHMRVTRPTQLTLTHSNDSSLR